MSVEFPTMSQKEAQVLFRWDVFQNGMAYYNAGSVRNPSRFGKTLYAQVQGSGKSVYTVIIEYDEEIKPRCSCPAARRTPFCKHTASVLAGWANAPDAFAAVEEAPAFTRPKVAGKTRIKKGKADTKELIARGLDSLETLSAELVLGGLASIGAERVEQMRELAENLRSYKLRRLSTLVLRFSKELELLLSDKERFSLSTYTDLLSDIILTTKGVQAIQQGKLQDPKYMEELVGKTWSERELTPRQELECVELFFEVRETVDNFRVFSSYFVELQSGELLSEKFIIPMHLKKGRTEKRSYAGLTLKVAEAYQYPGYPPFRIKLKQFDEGPTTESELERLVSRARGDFSQVAQAFRSFRKDFFAPSDYYCFLKPEGFHVARDRMSIFDRTGTAFELLLSERSVLTLKEILKSSPLSALFGKLHASGEHLSFEPLSAVVLSKDPGLQGIRTVK